MRRSLPSWLTRFVPTLSRRARRAAGLTQSARTHPHASFSALEPLEGRTLMSVAINAQGWTDIGASTDTRTIYVSSSAGSDSNNGLSSASPLKTIVAAQKLQRNGSPDWILLKKGDVFRETVFWRNSGRSTSEPAVLGAYGTGARPSIRPAAGADGIQMFPSTSVNNVAIVGIDLYAESRDPANGTPNTAGSTGIFALGNVDNLLIEDTSVRFFGNDLVVEQYDVNRPDNLQVRRSIFTDAYSATSGHSQGAYLDGINGILLEENLFDHNGWNDQVSGAVKTMYNHNIYMQSNNSGGAIIVKNNITTRASSHGLQARSGGTITGNLADENAIGLLVGGGDSPMVGGVVTSMTNNVVLESGDIGSDPRGWGIDITNLKSGLISGNIIAHQKSTQSQGHGIDIDSPVLLTTLSNNIVYDWATPLRLNNVGINVTSIANQLTSLNGANTFGYPDPERTVASYNASLGGAATLDAFVVKARQQSRDSWNAAYTASAATAYIRAGFTATGADIAAPSASLSAAGVSAAGGTSYTFTVTYSDNTAVNASTIGSGDVLVTGPNGFSQAATFVSVNNSTNGTPRTATYSITPPGGAWASTANGSYSVALVAGQVTDTSGNAAAGVLGSFSVGIAAAGDTTVPTASLSAAGVSAAGGTSYTFTVTYSDNAAVNASTIGAGDVRVTGPNGYSQLATFVSVNSSTNGTPRVATYSITPPGGAWASTANGTYSVALVAGQVVDTSGNAASASTLGSFAVNITASADTAAPTATLGSAPTIASAGGTTYTFTVVYADNVAVNTATIDSQDVLVTGLLGIFSQTATLVGVDNNTNGTPRTATYRITAPGGAWDILDNGTYTVSLKAGQVADTAGNTRPATTLGTFAVNIPVVTSLTAFSSIAGFGDRLNYTTLTPGRWTVSNVNGNPGLFLNTSSYDNLSGDRLGEMAMVTGVSLGDLSMTLKARSIEDLANNSMPDYAVVFGRVDANNYNYMLFNGTAAFTQLFTVVNGQRSVVATATAAGFTDNNYHDIKLLRVGSQVTVAVDGAVILNANDSRLTAVGGVGVGSYNDAAYFDDIYATTPVTTTLDNGNASVVASAGESTLTTRAGSVGGSYLSDGNAGKGSRTASYFPALTAGIYQIRLNSPGGSGLATNVQVDIYTAGGIIKTVTWNQTLGGYTNLGAFNLDSNSKIVVRNTGTSAEVISDAVQFIA
ncbi:MAG: hypothetical protein NTW19_00750 [Planctomycetota bacterium]|nr:hypothetical protein [Planctomycetota bacterium]